MDGMNEAGFEVTIDGIVDANRGEFTVAGAVEILRLTGQSKLETKVDGKRLRVEIVD